MIFANLFLKGYIMTAFEPPDFSFVGLQFNKDIFENTLTSSGTTVIPDPFPIGELDTNEIQALIPTNPVNLYTNFQNIINLGGGLVYSIALTVSNQISMSTQILYLLATDGARSMNIDFPTALNVIRQSWVADIINSSITTVDIEISPSVINPTLNNYGTFKVLCGSFYVGTFRTIQNFLETLGTISTLYFADENNPSVKTVEVNVLSQNSLIDNQGTYSINAGSLKTPNTVVSTTIASQQNLFGTTTSDIVIGSSGATGIRLLANTFVDTLKAVTPASSIINLFTNFTSGTTSTLSFGNEFLVEMIIKAKTIRNSFNNYDFKSITNPNQFIRYFWSSSTSLLQQFYIDNGNFIETCKMEVSAGATPTVVDTGLLTFTAGTISLTSPVVTLSTTAASSVINCNAQIVPAYAYNVTTGVLNTGAKGYFYSGTAPTAASLTVVNAKTSFTASTITIPKNGVYSISISMSIQCVTAGTHNRSMTYCDIYNGAATPVFQKTVGWGCLPSITGITGQVYPMCMTGIYALNGTTVANPWQFRLRFEYWYVSGTWSSFVSDFQYTIVRIA